MKQPRNNNLIELLATQAQRRGDSPAFVFLKNGEHVEDSITYRRLYQAARAAGAILRERCAERERAALLYPSGIDYIVAFFGCLCANLIAVPLHAPRPGHSDARIAAVIADCGAAVVLRPPASSRDGGDTRQEHGVPAIELPPHAALAGGDGARPVPDADSIAYLQYTSGSTGSPNGVMATHRSVLANLELIRGGFNFTEDDAFVSWLPLFHDMGLVGNVLTPIYLGVKCVLMSPAAFLQRPYRWLKAIQDHAASVAGGPNFAYDVCVERTTEEQRRELTLGSWRVAFNGAEPVRAATLARFSEAFAVSGFRPSAFHPCFGLAEATLLVGGHRDARPTTCRVDAAELNGGCVRLTLDAGAGTAVLVGCGKQGRGERIAIVAPDTGELLPEDRVGEIWVSGASIAAGYWDKPNATERTFRARLGGDGRTFLRTGDLGFLHDQELYIAGRLKDMIIVRGKNHFPQDIEYTVERGHAAIQPGGVAAFATAEDGNERLIVVAELRAAARGRHDTTSVIQSIQENIAARHQLAVHCVILIKARALPKTTSGKVQRRKTRELFLSGALDVIDSSRFDALPTQAPADSAKSDARSIGDIEKKQSAPPPATAAAPTCAPSASSGVADVRQWMSAWIAARTGRPAHAIDVTATFHSFGLDSIAAVEFAHALEERYGRGRDFSPTLVWEYPTIAALAGYVHRECTSPGSGGAIRAAEPVAVMESPADADLAVLVAQEIEKARKLL